MQSGEIFLVWLVIQRLPGTAAATMQKLYAKFGSAAAILEAPSAELQQVLNAEAINEFENYRNRGIRCKAGQRAQKDLEWLQQHSIKLLTIEDDDYPPLLKEVHYAPPLLMVDGDIKILTENQMAIVGSRKASPAGLEHARRFAHELVDCGFVITSGLAMGVDHAAHEGALQAGNSNERKSTIAVIATGLDLCYPSRHEKITQEIRENGAIISEFPLGTAPIKENFPRRNRIISGLSQGVLVVEAEEKSGSLITARYAIEQNREVFAIPGSINNPGSRGCHYLIRQGAHLTESVDDILRELCHPLAQQPLGFDTTQVDDTPDVSMLKRSQQQTKMMTTGKELLETEEIDLLKFLDESSISIDHLARRASKPVNIILSLLMSLEIKGWVENAGDGYRKI